MTKKKPAAKKSVKKSGKPSVKPSARRYVPQPHGGALVPGAGGGPQPGSGRPPDAFKAMCRELASSVDVELAVKSALADAKHPAFVGALKWASEHGYGKPKEHVQVDMNDDFGNVLREARERAKRANADA